METLWQTIEQKLQDIAPEVYNGLQEGATDAEISELEEVIGVQLPPDLVAFYRIHNGQSPESPGFIHCEEWLSLARILDEWQVWKGLLDGGNFTQDGAPQASDADEGIQPVWWHPHWLPITYDGSGNHYCLDLAPGEGGHVGQIIRMWHDDSERTLAAPSFEEWIRAYAGQLERDELVYSEDYGGLTLRED